MDGKGVNHMTSNQNVLTVYILFFNPTIKISHSVFSD